MSEEPKKWTERDQAKLDRIADQIRQKDGQVQQQISVGRMVIANCLIEAQELLAKPGCKSEFGAWVEGLGIELKKSSAYNYIAVAESFGKFKHAQMFAWSAMIELSGKAAGKAREQAMAIASQGTKVTVAKAKELIAKYSPKSDDQPRMDRVASKKDKPKGQRRADQQTESPKVEYDGQRSSTEEPRIYALGENQVILQTVEGTNRIEFHLEAAKLLLKKYQELTDERADLQSLLSEALEEEMTAAA